MKFRVMRRVWRTNKLQQVGDLHDAREDAEEAIYANAWHDDRKMDDYWIETVADVLAPTEGHA